MFSLLGKTAHCSTAEDMYFLKLRNWLDYREQFNPLSNSFLTWMNTHVWSQSQHLTNQGFTLFYKIPATHELYAPQGQQDPALEQALARVDLDPRTRKVESDDYIWIINKAKHLFLELSEAEDNFIKSNPYAGNPYSNYSCVLNWHLNGILVLKGSPVGSWAFYQDLELQYHRFMNVDKSLDWYREFSLTKFHMKLDAEADKILGFPPLRDNWLYTYDIPNDPHDNLLPAGGLPAGVRIPDHDQNHYAAAAPAEPWDDAHRVEHIADRLVQKILSELG